MIASDGVYELAGWHFLYHPILPGLAADSVFYGAIVWVLVRLTDLKRRLSRRRRGLCPSCGYPRTGLASSPCPECGRAV